MRVRKAPRRKAKGAKSKGHRSLILGNPENRQLHRGVEARYLVNELANPLLPCAICFRISRGFFYRHSRMQHHQYYPACSMQCQDAIAAICSANGGQLAQRAITQMERKAIVATRVPLAMALQQLGVLDHFKDVKPEHIDWLVLEVWNSVRQSMQQQSLQGDIPF